MVRIDWREFTSQFVYGGFIAAPAALEYAKNVGRNGADGSKSTNKS
jgi:hypothetical protein